MPRRNRKSEGGIMSDHELHELVEVLGEILAAVCVIALPFIVLFLAAALGY